MARITPSDLIKNMSGRTCTQSKEFFKTNRQTGKVTASKLCNPYTGPASEKQLAQREKFAQTARIVKAWADVNRPTSATDKGTPEFQAMMKQYHAQHEYGSWSNFVRSRIVNGQVPSFITGGSTPTPPANPGDDDHIE